MPAKKRAKPRRIKPTPESAAVIYRRLAEHYDDRAIAAILAKQKRRTATGLPFTRVVCV